MTRDAVKFFDLDAFFVTSERMGFNGEIKKLIFKDGKQPYGSAYIIPTDALPAGFDLTTIDQFGGLVVQVKEVSYKGTERFTTDFMIFPESLSGYVEDNSGNFTGAIDINDWTTGEMNFVINLEDGGGQEFYLADDGALISLTSHSTEEPQTFKTHKQVNKQLELLREKYPATCRIYGMERRDFDERRKTLTKTPDQ